MVVAAREGPCVLGDRLSQQLPLSVGAHTCLHCGLYQCVTDVCVNEDGNGRKESFEPAPGTDGGSRSPRVEKSLAKT